MLLKLMLFSLLVSLNLFAFEGEKVLNGYDAKVDVISYQYEAGPFLIYDCVAGHYVCVLEEYFKECQAKRTPELFAKKLELSCAPIQELPNKKSCFQHQLFMVSQNHGSKFCVGPSWKEKEIDL